MMSSAMQNELIDWLFRGQSITIDGQVATWDAPPSLYVGLMTSSTAEVTGTGYARVEVAGSLVNWAGTQGAGTTTASSGTSGQTSNNGAVTFPAPAGNWGTVTHVGIYDAATSGSLLMTGSLATPMPIFNGDAAPTFAAGALVFGVA